MNSPSQETCARCGLALTLEAAFEADEGLKKIEIAQAAILEYISKPTQEPLSEIIKRRLSDAKGRTNPS